MACVRRSVGSTSCSRVTAATTPICRFATRFFESVVEDGLGLTNCPLVGEQLIETWIVVMQAQQQFTQIGPWFDPMTLGAGEDREQDGRAGPGLPTAQEQPVFSPDRLVTECPFADVVVDRQPTILRVTTKCAPLIAGVPDRLRERALGQRPSLQLREACVDKREHRFRLASADFTSRVGQQRASLILDVVQLADPLQDLVRISW